MSLYQHKETKVFVTLQPETATNKYGNTRVWLRRHDNNTLVSIWKSDFEQYFTKVEA